MPEPAKAEPLIVVNPAGRFTLVKLVAPAKACWPICVNPLGSLMLLKLEQPLNRLVGKLVTWVEDKSMVVREVQPLKIEEVAVEALVVVPKLVKLFGTFTSVKLKQPWKAWLPILVTLLEANVTLVREVIPSKAPWLASAGVPFFVTFTYPVIALTLAGMTMLAKPPEKSLPAKLGTTPISSVLAGFA